MIYSKRLGSLILVLVLMALAGSGCSRKARQARLMRAADAYFAAESYGPAEANYKQALQRGMDAHALGRLGMIYSREGRMQLAFACLKKSDELNPKDPAVKSAFGLAYASFQDAGDAFRLAKQALALQSTNREALVLLGETVPSTEEIPDARAFLGALPRQARILPEYDIALATLDLATRNFDAAEIELRQAIARDPNSSDAHYRLSQIYYARTNLAQATNELKTAAALSPWRSPIRLKVVDVALQAGHVDAARQALEEIISHAPDFIPARTALMRQDFARRHYDECRKDIASVLELDPDNYDAAVEAGMVSLGQGKPAEAFAAFQKLEARRPNVPEVKYYLGLAALGQGESAKGRQYLNEAVDLNTNYLAAIMLLAQVDLRTQNPGAAIQRLERLTRREPSLVEARLLLAQAYLTRQEMDPALAIYRQLMQQRPKDAQYPYFMGLALAQSGRFADAAVAFGKSLELAPGFPAALEHLIQVEVQQKQYATALKIVQRGLDKSPKSGVLYFLQAGIYHAELQDQPAEEALNKAVALQPDLVPAYVFLADLDVAQHKEQQALDKLEAIVSRTNDVTALLALGVLQQKVNRFDAARASYEKLLTVDPNFIPALNNLAYLYSENLGQVDKACLYAQKAHDLRLDDPSAADTLGWALFKRGDYPRALTLLEEGAAGEPGDPEVQYHLGMIHYMLGEEAPARLALQNAVASITAFGGKERARQCLEILSIDPQSADAKAVAVLEKAVEQEPRDLAALTRLAAIDERDGAFDKAAQYDEKALQASPKNPSLMARLAALYADRLHRPDDAMKLARNAHALEADNFQACAILGRLTYDHGDFPNALALLQNAAGQDQASSGTYADLARAAYAMGDVPAATAAMQTAAARSKPGPGRDVDELFLTLAGAAGSPAAAKAALPQAKAVLQADGRALPALMVCAAATEAAGDYKGAEQYYDTAVAAFPQFTPALRQSAILLATRLGDDDRAYGLAEKARTAFPGDPALAKILGRGAYRSGNYALSSEILQDASFRVADGEALYYLGMDYYKLNRSGESKHTLEKALTLNLPPALAADAKRVLGTLK